MESLQRIIVTRLQWLAILLLMLILPVASLMQVSVLQGQAQDNAHAAFQQIRQVLQENTQELETIQEEYRETCLHNAEAIAYMIQYHPEILGDIEEFRMIARMMEVDEIHIFDKTGRIFTGTHPEYYDFTFETGEQIGFFAPLLRNKSLRLCQDITPNTAEGKMVQYSALWSADREFIVQVGMYPETILEYTEKNQLSYIFSLLQGSVGVELYAADAETGKILGSTSGHDNGRHLEEIGLRLDAMDRYRQGAQAQVRGVDCYCIFTDMDGTLIGYTIATDTLYRSLPMYLLTTALYLAILVFVVLALMWRILKIYIMRSIEQVNGSLSSIAEGNLDERVNVKSSREFAQLSDHINNMVRSILATTDKMEFVLDHTNLRIGVYEYSTRMKTVRFTEQIPNILEWDADTRSRLSSDHTLLQEYFSKILSNPVPGEKNTFRLEGARETYVKLEELVNGHDTLGILIDVSETILTRRRIERERDIDLLTGLYNRRAMERMMDGIFRGEAGCGALVMVDADNLKFVNDVYGHGIGDRYLKRLAQVLSEFGTARHIAARQGGDEFLLLLYDYPTEEAVLQDLESLRQVAKNTWLLLESGENIQVQFSYGYVLTTHRQDYDTMISEADGHMYAAKRKRKRPLIHSAQ